MAGRPGGSGWGRARALAVDITPLRASTGYRAMWFGQIVSLVGTHMRYVAVPFQVFSITGSTVAVGLLGLAEVVPLIVFSIVGGAIADSVDRRKILVVTQVLMLVDSLALAAVSLGDDPSLIAIYGLTATGAALSSVDRPARSAMTPALVRPEMLPAAMALRQVVFQTTQIVGPALGGLLIAALSGEVAGVYIVDAATYVAAMVALRWIPSDVPERSEESTSMLSLGMVREGLSFALRTPLILSIFIIDFVAMIFGMPRAVFPELAAETFDAGSAVLGLLYAAPAAGALAGALTSGWVSLIKRQGVAVLVAVTVWGVAITLAGLTLFSLPLTLLMLGIAGAADVISAVFRGTILLQATPDALLGRANALNLMVVTGGPRLGDVEAGFVAGAIGPGPSIVFGGAMCLAATGVVAAAFKPVRDYVAPAPAAPDPTAAD